MRKFVIERDIPEIGKSSPEELHEGVCTSNRVLSELGPDIQWKHSYVTGDKIFCIYLAKDKQLIHEHAERTGFPATRINEVTATTDPATENDEPL